MNQPPKTSRPGIVDKVIPGVAGEPEKAQIAIQGGDDLYREIRIENKLAGEEGEEVKMKPGAHVTVTIEADPKETVPSKSK
jgi:hypothetical protein